MTSARDLLQKRGLAPKKSFGQNFLHDDTHLSGIANAISAIAGKEPVIEFGAGLGALTKALLEQGLVVHAVERDRDLVPILREHFADFIQGKKLILHEDNAATFDWRSDVAGAVTLCGNLPYHLSSVLLFRTLEMFEHIKGAVYLLQQEVVERIVAAEGSKTRGLLSVLLQARFHVDIVRYVPSGAFWPPPQVDSAVVRLVRKPDKEQPQIDQALFKKVVKQAFSQRRKTIKNTLQRLSSDVDAWLLRAQIDPKERAEDLSVQDFVRLVQSI